MKFLLLGSGDIARKCIESYLKKNSTKNELIALIGDQQCYELLHNNGNIRCELFDGKEKTEIVINEIIHNLQPDFVLSVQYPWIISSRILALLPNSIFNIHNAKLPEYRGHHTISYEIINDEKTHVSTLHIISKEVDRGYIVNTRKTGIYNNDTAFSLWQRSSLKCVELFNWLITELDSIDIKRFSPVKSGGHFYSRFLIDSKKNVPINSSNEVKKKYARAFYFPPYEPAYTIKNGKKIYLEP